MSLNGGPGRFSIEVLRALIRSGDLEEAIIFVGLIYVNCGRSIINREPGYGIYFRFHDRILPFRIAVSQA